MFDIFVQDVNESPTNLYITDEDGVSNFPRNKPAIPENWMKDSIIGTIEAIDQDTVTNLKFEIMNDLDSMFKLGSPVTCSNQSFFNGRFLVLVETTVDNFSSKQFVLKNLAHFTGKHL